MAAGLSDIVPMKVRDFVGRVYFYFCLWHGVDCRFALIDCRSFRTGTR